LIQLLKLAIRAALWLFCTDVHIKNKHLLSKKGSLLIIANHPNSFLDAIIIAANYKRRIYFLARGDVFNKKHHQFFLRCLNMIPVYRLREGKENLHLNEYAFKESIRLLSQGEAVLVFIEGICLNTHQLQPFKKGTTRILEGAQKQTIFPEIQILGIAYNQLKGIGKKINIGIVKYDGDQTITNARDRVLFNEKIATILKEQINLPLRPTIIKKTPFYFIHYHYYKLLYQIVAKKTKGTVFFDSVLFSLLLFTYPLFLCIIYFLLTLIHIPHPIILIILLSIPILSKNSVE